MTIRIKHLVLVRAWKEAEERNALFAPDSRYSEVIIDNMEHLSSGVLTIEDGTNMALPLPDIQTVAGVSFVSDQDVDVAINGQAALPLRKPSAGTEDAPTSCSFFWEGPLTSVNIAKADDTPDADAHIFYVVFGNPED